jgi:DeoR/GlpR family transcriptional regulator of sugar metabolism
MLKQERHTLILKKINLHNKVLSSDLSVQLNVSEDTVRRDLNELADEGSILKVHGGAVSKGFHFPFKNNETYSQNEKKIVARKALSLIKTGMTILTGGGTTMIEMARMFPDDVEATFFTISPLVALELSEHAQLTVILLGGQLSKNSQVNMGSKTISDLYDIGVDLCFLGANCIDASEGVTDSDWEVVQVKKAMIKSASKLAIVSIAEKLNSVQKLNVCKMNAVDYLITDIDSDDPCIAAYAAITKVM